jgi:hypothetical protein
MIRRPYIYFCFIFSSIILLSSCEDPYTPPTSPDDQQYVVEGYLEHGQGALPTYVMITKSLPYLTTIKPNQINELFVQNAKVVVNDGLNNVPLDLVCTSQLPPAIRKQALEALGLNPDSTVIDICIYIDLFNQISKKEGGKYDLTVTIGEKIITSTTTIPVNVPLTKPVFKDPPGEPSDSLAALWVSIDDPVGRNYYRYLTSIDKSQNLVAPFQSTTDDAFFDSKKFDFPLNKAELRGGGGDVDAFGLFARGDSCTIKWMTLDKPHFDFWTTRDFAANNQGPFGSYTRIKTNINGGLGIWGGYAVNTYKLYCPPK